MKHLSYLLILLLLLANACNQNPSAYEPSESFKSDHEAWQKKRLEGLKSDNGWLNLAGLFWLEEGANSFGSDSSNSLVFPEPFPLYGGNIILKDSIISIQVKEDVTIAVNDSAISDMQLRHDQQKQRTILEHGSFRWFILKRGVNYAVRLRDLEHPRIESLDHIPSYPVSEDWILEADFIAFDSVRTIEVPTVIPGFSEYYKVPGELRFKKDRKTYSLLPFKSGKGYFLIVGDATNGNETYGAGRFMYTNQIEGDKVILDFNRAYNPPCAFSPFATCPLPPLENILELDIEAGEKAVHLE